MSDEHDDRRAAPDDLVRRLPTAHAVALRMWRHGATTDDIADALGIDVEAVPDLLDIARRKLDALGHDPPGTLHWPG